MPNRTSRRPKKKSTASMRRIRAPKRSVRQILQANLLSKTKVLMDMSLPQQSLSRKMTRSPTRLKSSRNPPWKPKCHERYLDQTMERSLMWNWWIQFVLVCNFRSNFWIFLLLLLTLPFLLFVHLQNKIGWACYLMDFISRKGKKKQNDGMDCLLRFLVSSFSCLAISIPTLIHVSFTMLIYILVCPCFLDVFYDHGACVLFRFSFFISHFPSLYYIA